MRFPSLLALHTIHFSPWSKVIASDSFVLEGRTRTNTVMVEAPMEATVVLAITHDE